MDHAQAAIRRLIRDASGHVKRRRKLQLLIDFDGTIAPLTEDPLAARANPQALRSLYILARHSHVEVTFVTGRTIDDLRHRFGKSSTVPLPFHIIGSFGTERQMAGKNTIMLESFPPGSTTVLHEFNQAATDLQACHPGLIVQKKHGTVNIDVRYMHDQDPIRRASVINDARRIFAMMSAHPAMPLVNGAPLFQIRQESSYEICIRADAYDKAHGIRKSRHIDPYDMTIFMGDSFGPHGGDRSAAILINDTTQFFNGMVMQVMNGRDGPVDPKSPEAPAYVLANTDETAKFLNRLVTAIHAHDPKIRRGNSNMYKGWPYFMGP
jgi:trehalose-phosphatase